MKKLNKFLLSLGSVASLASLPLIAAKCGGTDTKETKEEKELNKEVKSKFKDELTKFVFTQTYRENNEIVLDKENKDPNWKEFKAEFDKGIDELKNKKDFEEYKKNVVEDTEEYLSAVFHLSKDKDGKYLLNGEKDKTKDTDYKDLTDEKFTELTKKFEEELKKLNEEIDKIFAPVLQSFK